MLKKAGLLFFLLFLNILYPLGLTTPVYAQSPSQISEITYLSNNIAITPANISEITQNEILLGYIFGGNVNYNIRAGFYINGNYVVKLSYKRNNNLIYIELTNKTPDFTGTISFPDCCSNVLMPLTLSITILNSTKTFIDQNSPLYLSFAIFTINYYEGLVSKYQISSVNAIGYPYPPRAFIVGLMILLTGLVPVFILDKALLKVSRR